MGSGVFVSFLFFFFLVEQRDKFHDPPTHTHTLLLEKDQLQGMRQETAALGST